MITIFFRNKVTNRVWKSLPTGPWCWPSGSLTTSVSFFHQFQVANVPIFDFSECQEIYEPYQQNVEVGMICAGSTSASSADTCQADGGGPLFLGGTDVSRFISWTVSLFICELVIVSSHIIVRQFVWVRLEGCISCYQEKSNDNV